MQEKVIQHLKQCFMQTTKQKPVIEAGSVIGTINQRRAVRKFTSQPVTKKIIEQLLHAGRMAPSAMNRQPWQFYILTNRATIKAFSTSILQSSKMAMFKAGIKEAVHFVLLPGSFHLKDGAAFFKAEDPIFHGAPLVIFITSPKDNEWASLDIGMCAQNMMLAATSLGLGSCPVGFAKFVEHADIYKKLKVPGSHQVNLALIFGYADEKPTLHPRKKDNAFYIDKKAIR